MNQGIALRVPVRQAPAPTTAAGAIARKVSLASLPWLLGDLALDPPELPVQPRALDVQIHQALQRHQQPARCCPARDGREDALVMAMELLPPE